MRGEPRVPCRAGGRLLSRLHLPGVATPHCCAHAPPAVRDVSAAPLAPGHPREGGQALDRSGAADALPLKAALLHLDTDFEPHRLSHGPGDAAVTRPATRRVVVVLRGSDRPAGSRVHPGVRIAQIRTSVAGEDGSSDRDFRDGQEEKLPHA